MASDGDVNRVLRAIGIALPPAVFIIAALLAWDAWRRIGPDTDSAIAEFIIAGMTLLFAAKAARDSYFPRAPKFVAEAAPSSRERKRLRVIVFAVGATVVLVAASAIADKPHDPIVWLGSGGFILIGMLVMFGAWHARTAIDDETKLRMLWWILAGGFLLPAASFWNNLPALVVFALPASVFSILAVRASLRFGRFGRTDLTWEAEPLRVGETAHGRLRMSRLAAQNGDSPFLIRMSAFSEKLQRTGRSTASLHDRLKLLWSSEVQVRTDQVELAPNDQVTIPIEFTLPPTAPRSGTMDGVQVHWQLDVTRVMQGIDYAATFSVRVI